MTFFCSANWCAEQLTMISQEELDNEVSFVEIGGNVLLFVLVFGMSATVDVNSVQDQLKNYSALGTGIFLQFFVLPFLGFLTVKILDMNSTMGIILLVVTSSPGGSYSNWWCSMFNGDLALSVTMTTISTLLSILMLPVNLLIYTSQAFDANVVENINWDALILALVVVISAIMLGLFCSANVKWPAFNAAANKLGNLGGISLVIFSALMCSSEEEASLMGRSWKFYIGVAAPCVIGLISANIFASYANLDKPERVTVAIECCYQNVGIASSVALTMFKGSDLAEALGVPLYYGMIEAIFVCLYCVIAWKMGWTKAPASENLCTVIATSYETPSRDGYAEIV